MSLNISSYLSGVSGYGNKAGVKVNTNTAQYKAAERDYGKKIDAEYARMSAQERLIFEMLGGREAYLKNVSKLYDANGDFVGATGVAGMLADGIPLSEQHQMIDVSEEYRQKMFDMVKEEFIRENGVANGDTTRRSEVFKEYQLSIKKEDRLKGTWSLEQYEQQYRSALAAAVKAANPNWKNGQPFDASVLDGITRESIESTLVKSGNTLVRKGVNYSI